MTPQLSGPICWSAEIEQGVIVLIDLDRGGRSITNDAEAVICHLRRLFDLTTHRVIYRDTMGLWDGLAVDQTGRFSGFVMLQMPSREAAIAAAVSRETWSAR